MSGELVALKIMGGIFCPRLGCFDLKTIYEWKKEDMKTREIKVWVTDDKTKTINQYIESEEIRGMQAGRINGQNCKKARLIIEEPERKVTISESEFDKIIGTDFGVAAYRSHLDSIKEKIFGKEE